MEGANLDPLNYTYIFNAEKAYDEDNFNVYMQAHWVDSFVYSGVYLTFVFGGLHYMNKQKRGFELRPYLAAWSSLLAVFSIIGAFRTTPELVSSLQKEGLEYTCCSISYMGTGKITSFWTMMFTLSKVIELGDTMFIILRKQPLVFLHWYHHTTVLVYSWYSYSQYIATGRWFVVMNYLVHSFMYTYYAFRAMKFRFPRLVSILITSLQITQMMMGITVTVVSYFALKAGRSCHQNYSNIQFGLFIYFSYFILFGQFFYSTYITKPSHEKQK